MFGIIDLGEYIAGAIGVILLPGPNSMYCLTAAAKYGIRRAYCAVGGILLGDSTLVLLSALGATSVIKTIPVLFLTLKIIGGLYLAYLGGDLIRVAVKKFTAAAGSHAALVPSVEIQPANIIPTPFFIFRHALCLSMLNPKGILFFLAFFVQFVDPNYDYPALSFFMLALILQFCSISYLSVLIFCGVALVRWFQHYRRVAATIIGLVGVMFIGFALRLWTATIN